MTWTAFYGAMRSGAAYRVNTMMGRQGARAASSSASTTKAPATSESVLTRNDVNATQSHDDDWDFMVLDEFGEPRLPSLPW
mmetsp:Transcript_4697/g.12282  ORF Transcript_4697/g.12282 Transcript_4697/m.12282 type:complete len:81 (+) Transcript_4697:940-1182(+)